MAVLVLLALLAVLAAVLGLRSQGFRQWVLARTAAALETSTGLVLTAGDFSLETSTGKLTVTDLALRASAGAEPFLTVPRATAEVRWRTLRSDLVVVPKLELENPVLDLGAPFPQGGEEDGEEPGTSVDLPAIRITGGSILSGEMAESWDPVADRWRLTAIDLAGSYRSGAIAGTVASARGIVESARRPPIEASVEGAFTVDDGGLAIEGLEVDGDGLALRAEGRWAEASALSFDLDAEPAELFPDLGASGSVALTGDLGLDAGRLTGDLRADVRALPGEVVEPWIAGSDALPSFAGTRLDLDADLDLDLQLAEGSLAELTAAEVADRLAGHAHLAWYRHRQDRPDERLLTATVRSLDGEATGLQLAFEADVLPETPGKRQVRGELRAPGWLTVADGSLRRARLDLDLSDLAAAAKEFGLDAAKLGFEPFGTLRATVTADGALKSPRLAADATWSVEGETLATLDLRSLDGVGDGVADLRLAAAVLPDDPGRRQIAGNVRAAFADFRQPQWQRWRLDGARVDLELPDVAAVWERLSELWQRLLPASEPPAPGPLAAGSLTVEARADGPLLQPAVEVDGRWRPAPGLSRPGLSRPGLSRPGLSRPGLSRPDEEVRVTGQGVVAAAWPYFQGTVRTELQNLELTRFASEDEPAFGGRVTGTLDFEGNLDEHQARLELDGRALRLGAASIDHLRIAAYSDGTALEIQRFDGDLGEGRTAVGGGTIVLGSDRRLRSLDLELVVPQPVSTLERLVATATLDGDTIAAEIAIAPSGAQLRPVALARAPLALLGLPEALVGPERAVPVPERTVQVLLSELDLEPFVALLETGEDGVSFRPQAIVSGSLTVDLDDLLGSTGTLEASDVALETELGTVTAAETLRFELADRRLELLAARVLTTARRGAAMEVSGTFDLAAPESGGVGVEHFDLEVEGRFDVAELDPLFAGGRAAGQATVDLRVYGPPSAPLVDGTIDGSAATLIFPATYGTRIEAPVAELSASGGNTFIEVLKARLNGGDVEITGDLGGPSGTDLFAVFDGVRYRLDYGLTVLLSGDLAYHRPSPTGSRALLSGAVSVERGTVRRDLDVDRELLSLLLAPETSSFAEDDPVGEDIDLDLVLTTAEGVRIKNNLADLRADWGRLRVRGTLAQPLVSGRLDVDPGGRINAYGQTVRIDEASVEFSGDPAVGPRVDLELTSSLDDPSLRVRRAGPGTAGLGERGPGTGSFWDAGSDTSLDRGQEMTEGLLTYYSDRVAGTLSQGLENTELSLEPLPLFGETDTQARLTATRRLSRFADLIYSVNPREAEGQTYILSLHDFDFAPSFAAQLFTNDEDNAGFTIVQTLELGGEPKTSDQWRLERIRIEAPDEISERRIRLAFGIRRGDILPEGAAFDFEIEALEELRRQGYPGAEVKVSLEPPERWREIWVKVDPGPKVNFEFEGDKPSSAARRRIVQIYRPADEVLSFEEMRRETVTALRQQGFIDPEVTITSDGGEEVRNVRIVAEGGRRISPSRLEFQGVDERTAELLEEQFESRLVRVELADGVPGADRYLVRSLKALGYPQAEITGRELLDEGRRLTVRIDLGPRQYLADLEITGVSEEESDRLRSLLPLAEGQPARSDAVTRSAHALEDDLRRRGFVDASVRTVLEPATDAGSDPGKLPMELRFDIDPGAFHRLAEVRFEGLRGTRESWVENVAEIEAGDVYREQEVGDARRRLMRTGLFESIRFDTQTSGGGGPVETSVVFDLEERPRYRVAYGGRWESDEGAGVVVEAIDTNFLGRGSTFGTRAIYSGDERSLRLYHSLPRVAGTRGGLEIFVEGREEEVEDTFVDGIETWVQHTFPISRRTRNRLYLRYQDFRVRDLEPAGTETPPGQQFVLPALGWQLTYDRRERAIGARPGDGLAAGLDLSGSDRALGSDASFLGLFSQLKYFRSFGRERGRGVTWAQWWRIGVLETSGDVLLPTVTRLRAGGEFSVRGYRRNSLGPLDEEGNALGGEAFFLINQELHFPLWGDNLSGVAFFDAGNVWETLDAVDSELFTAAGVGLRAATALGPLRLDIAFPLDRRPGDDGVKVYVGFGNIF